MNEQADVQSDATFDVIVVGGGSAGAVIASRLSEDPSCRVALVEAGGPPPDLSAMPAACAALQNDPETDWMFEGDPGEGGKSVLGGSMMVPRGKMLGGSSSLNYMAYVRGHPGDFDAWAEAGGDGWSYEDVLPYFRKSEGLQPSGDVVIDPDAHGTDGPLGVSVRSPVLQAASEFVQAANNAGIPSGDYNGRDRGGATGVASLFQTSTKDGKRSSTYTAFLVDAMDRDNLTVFTHAQVQRVVLDDRGDGPTATGIEYRDADGAVHTISASKEVVLSAGAIGSPQLLMLSGIGPADHLREVGIDTVVDLPDVGQHLQDHLHAALFFEADGIAVPMAHVGVAMGPDALRAPAGPLPADPADDADLPPELAGLKAEAERQLTEWATTGRGLVSSSLYDAVAFYSTGLGDEHSHDAQIAILTAAYTDDLWRNTFRMDPDEIFDDPAARLDAEAQMVVILPNIVQPHSTGQVTLTSADPADRPKIELGYFTDPHDLEVMVSVMRRAMEIADAWPGDGLGAWLPPKKLADQHGYTAGDEPSDELLRDIAQHYALTVYHETSTCRIGDVVDADLRVQGVVNLRVADASVMPRVVSGNTNAAAIMIGEKAAELVAGDHGITLAEFVGTSSSSGAISIPDTAAA